jgi:hypothetical protein
MNESSEQPRGLTDEEKKLAALIREMVHDVTGKCVKVAAPNMGIDHGTALTIAHREIGLISLGLLGSLLTGQETDKSANDMLFMAQTRYQLDMQTMIDSYEKFSGRKIEREFMPGAVYNA